MINQIKAKLAEYAGWLKRNTTLAVVVLVALLGMIYILNDSADAKSSVNGSYEKMAELIDNPDFDSSLEMQAQYRALRQDVVVYQATVRQYSILEILPMVIFGGAVIIGLSGFGLWAYTQFDFTDSILNYNDKDAKINSVEATLTAAVMGRMLIAMAVMVSAVMYAILTRGV